MLHIQDGVKYNMLTVIKEVNGYKLKNGINQRRFLCKCDCGNKTEVAIGPLVHGRTKSCGCINRRSIRLGNSKSTIRTKRTKELLEDFKFWTNTYFNNGIFSAERKVAKEKIKDLIIETEIFFSK